MLALRVRLETGCAAIALAAFASYTRRDSNDYPACSAWQLGEGWGGGRGRARVPMARAELSIDGWLAAPSRTGPRRRPPRVPHGAPDARPAGGGSMHRRFAYVPAIVLAVALLVV